MPLTATTKLPDGSTPGQREMIASQLSVAVSQIAATLQNILDGKLSLSSVFVERSPLFSKTAFEARSSIQRAQEQLNQQFLPAALNALRDYDRPLPEVVSTINGYLTQLEGQVGAALKAESRGRITNILNEAARTGSGWLKKAGQEGGSNIVDLVFSHPAVTIATFIGGGVALAYIWRSFK
jgi:hypothetical protein